jgi:hypothetical protein
MCRNPVGERGSTFLSTIRLCVGLGVFLLTTLLCITPAATAQESPSSTSSQKNSVQPTRTRLSKNEFGLWTGYSPFSFKLKGISEDRKLFLLNLQYARELLTTCPLTLKYTAELVPVALEKQPTQLYIIGGSTLVNPSGTIYGAGMNPVGLQGNFGNKSVQPFANGSVGFLYFTRQVPILESSQFNYTISIGMGAQFIRRSGRTFTVGWKYHHLSNNYQAMLNPGIDSSLFFAGFSIFPKGR